MSRKVIAVYLVAILLASPLSTTVALAETVDGGVANAAGNAPAVSVPDATLSTNANGEIEIAYNASGVDAALEDLEVRLTGPNGIVVRDLTARTGTVNVTLNHSAPGDFRVGADLVDTSASDWEKRYLASDSAVVSVRSPVSIADFSVTNTATGNSEAVFAGEEFTLRTTLENSADSEQALNLYGYLGLGERTSGQRTVTVANDETIVSLNVTAPDYGFEYETNVQVNDGPSKSIAVEEPPTVDVTVTNVSRATDERPSPGDEVTFTATVKNQEDTYGKQKVTIRKDGDVVDTRATRTVYLPAGGTDTVTFSTTFDTAGEHNVSVNNATPTVTSNEVKNVTVKEPLAKVVSVDHVGGEAPDVPITTDHVSVEAPESENQLLEIELKDGHSQDLSGLGIDQTSEFEFTVELDKSYSPDVLIAGAQNVSWTVKNESDHYRITMRASPLNTHYYFGPTSTDPWPEQNLTATQAYTPELSLAIDDMPDDSDWTPLKGMIIATDSQSFSSPTYIPPRDGREGKLTYHVAAPHYLPNGEVNQGYYEAFIPDSLLEEWGVSGSELEAHYQNRDLGLDVNTSVTGGVKVTATYHYSSGTVKISPADSSDTGGDPTGGGFNDVPDTGSGPTTTTTTTNETTTENETTTANETATVTTTATTEAGLQDDETTVTATTAAAVTTQTTTETTSTTTTSTTQTTTETTTEAATSTTSTTTQSSSGVPGFGVSAALVALAAAALLAIRRTDR